MKLFEKTMNWMIQIYLLLPFEESCQKVIRAFFFSFIGLFLFVFSGWLCCRTVFFVGVFPESKIFLDECFRFISWPTLFFFFVTEIILIHFGRSFQSVNTILSFLHLSNFAIRREEVLSIDIHNTDTFPVSRHHIKVFAHSPVNLAI